ncbi:hypothetical protein QOT17_012008 [Balamuthia mandrillaris]
MQKSFQLSLNIFYETSDKSKKCKELIFNLLWSADHTSFNAFPPSTPQLSLIMPALPTLFPRIQPSTLIIGLENSTPAGPFTSSSHTQHPTSIM